MTTKNKSRTPTALMTFTILWACFTVACGSGSTASPTAPSATTPVTTAVPAPTPAPVAQYPSMTGGWSGTLNISAVTRGSGVRSSNICTNTWIVTTQNAGRFSGTYQLSGGTTASCTSAGDLSGDVSTSGTLSGLSFTSPPQTGATTCTRISGDGTYSGVVSNASAVTASSADAQRCTTVFAGGVPPPITAEADRTLTLTMNKR